MREMIYFGACDRQMESFIDEKTFVDSLVYGILFQGDLVVPDIYFYISSHISNVLLQAELRHHAKFFLHSVATGAIIPSFRDTKHESFQSNLDAIEASGIQGVLDQRAAIAKKLDAAVRGKRLHPHFWPEDAVSAGFKKTVERALSTSIMPADSSPDTEILWHETQELRHALVEKASLDGLGGIRRGELYNIALSEAAGVKKTIHDIREIWTGLDQQKASQIRRVLKWVNYCYYYNQGRMFKLKPCLSSLDDLDVSFARRLAMLEDGYKLSASLYSEVTVPSAASLLTIKPELLFEARDSDIGMNYFDALQRWQLSPSAERAGALREALRAYADLLRTTYMKHGAYILNWKEVLRAHIPEGPTLFTVGTERYNLRDQVLNLGDKVPVLSKLSVVGKVAPLLYSFLPLEVRERIAPFGGGDTQIRIDVDQHHEIMHATKRGKRSPQDEAASAVFQ